MPESPSSPADRQTLPPPIVSRAALGPHPLHPMTVHFPVAALLGLVAVDVAWWFTADPFWSRAGLWLAGVGAAGGWMASSLGLIDLLTVARIREKITAWCHAIIAVMLLSAASLNWLLRYREDDSVSLTAPWLSLLAAVLIGLAAWLGGRLVYEHAVGVDARPNP
jgi:uncharacterized membrane protein